VPLQQFLFFAHFKPFPKHRLHLFFQQMKPKQHCFPLHFCFLFLHPPCEGPPDDLEAHLPFLHFSLGQQLLEDLQAFPFLAHLAGLGFFGAGVFFGALVFTV